MFQNALSGSSILIKGHASRLLSGSAFLQLSLWVSTDVQLPMNAGRYMGQLWVFTWVPTWCLEGGEGKMWGV